MSSRFSSFDGLELAYLDQGSGPPVIALHGFASDAAGNWIRSGVADALVAAGRRVVAPDARGHGRSAKPHDPAAYAGGAMTRDVVALADHLGLDRYDVCGYSMGAMTAYALGVTDPRVRSVVLGGVGDRQSDRGLAARAPRVTEALLAPDPAAITDPVGRAFRDFADFTGADRLALAALQRARTMQVPAGEGGPALPVAVLVIAGDDDQLAGSPGPVAARIPRARSVVVTGNHLSAVLDPAFARAVVDFLAEVDALS